VLDFEKFFDVRYIMLEYAISVIYRTEFSWIIPADGVASRMDPVEGDFASRVFV